MQPCVNSEGNYFEGNRSWFPEFVRQEELQAQSRFFVSDHVYLHVNTETRQRDP